jgi:hypothetical protein
MKERLKPILEVGIIALALYGLNFLAFSKELKEQVEKNKREDVIGVEGKLKNYKFTYHTTKYGRV